MPASNVKPTEEALLGELRLGRPLTAARQVAAGGLVLALALALVAVGRLPALAAGRTGALASLLAFGLLALTTLVVFELLGGSGEPSSSHALVLETLGPLGGFLSGWGVLAAGLALASLFVRAAAGQAAALTGRPDLALWGGPLLLVLLAALHLAQRLPSRRLLWPAFLGLLAAVLISGLTAASRLAEAPAAPPVPVGAAGLGRGTAWLALGYLALESVLGLRRQTRDPERALPPALLATLSGTALLTLTAALTLGAYGVPALERLAQNVSAGASVRLLLTLLLLLAANVAWMTAVRTADGLARRGLLPPALRRPRPLFRLPPLLLLGLLAPALGLTLLPETPLLDLAAALALAPPALVNLTALRSRSTEPERRRPFTVPFHPLAPLLSLTGLALLALALPRPAVAAGLAWFGLGTAFYLAYGRDRYLAAQAGVSVFRRTPRREKPEGTYRILLPLAPGAERGLLLALATSIARQMSAELIPLQVIPVPDPLAVESGRRRARETSSLFEAFTRSAVTQGVSVFPITRLARSAQDGILDTAVEEDCDLILMGWQVEAADGPTRTSRVLNTVVRRAPCDVAVVGWRPAMLPAEEENGPPALALHRLLVPTAGGPHAPLATRLALLLAREHQATVEVVYVQDPEAPPEQRAQAEARIADTLRVMAQELEALMGPQEDGRVRVTSRLVQADSPLEGILLASAGTDLVFLGASEESLIDQVLFGTLPEQVAARSPAPVVMAKRYQGLRRLWLRRVWDGLYQALPTLTAEERIQVYKEVRRGARPDADFFVMMGLAAVIATYGLLQDSGAVIIGAMLVAPLFTPILALSLAIVHGDLRLLRLSVEASLKGIALAVVTAALLAAASPLRVTGQEVLSRTSPNLFDLAIALASGAAGAYAVARKEVATALPGVAIAAALVPPLCVAGIGLAELDAQIAFGGGLLFATNLVAITLAGALTLLLLGFRPARAEEEARLRLGLSTSLLLLLLVTVPLAVIFLRTARATADRRAVRQVLERVVAQGEALELTDLEVGEAGGTVQVTARLLTEAPLPPQTAEDLRAELSRALRRPVQLRLILVPVESVEARPP